MHYAHEVPGETLGGSTLEIAQRLAASDNGGPRYVFEMRLDLIPECSPLPSLPLAAHAEPYPSIRMSLRGEMMTGW